MVLEPPTATPDLLWHLPEPIGLWIDAAPQVIAGEEPWIDPRTRDLGGIGRRPQRARARPPHGPTTVYLPPLATVDDELAQGVRAWCEASGVPLLVHTELGSAPDAGTPLVDCLRVVIEEDWEALAGTPEGAVVLWPLLPGLGDGHEALAAGLELLRGRTVRAVVGFVPELARRARRRLAQSYGEIVFDALFHPRPVDPRRFAAACRKRDLEFLPRRLLGTAPRRTERRIAAELALVADLLLELDASPARAQRFYRAARWVEATPHHLATLAREGNLGVVPFLDHQIAALIEDLVGGRQRSRLLADLIDRWVAS